MIKTISNYLQKISSGWLVLSTILIMFLFMSLVLPNQAKKSLKQTGSSIAPDTSFFYTPDDLFQIAEEYGPDGRLAYIKARWSFDLIFPLVYTAFLAIGISWLSMKLGSWDERWKIANLVPMLGGVFDYLENGAASIYMAAFPKQIPGLAWAASTFTLLKWVLICLAFLVYLLFGIAALSTWIKSR